MREGTVISSFTTGHLKTLITNLRVPQENFSKIFLKTPNPISKQFQTTKAKPHCKSQEYVYDANTSNHFPKDSSWRTWPSMNEVQVRWEGPMQEGRDDPGPIQGRRKSHTTSETAQKPWDSKGGCVMMGFQRGTWASCCLWKRGKVPVRLVAISSVLCDSRRPCFSGPPASPYCRRLR